MSRWLAFIKLFDLKIVHVPAKQHELVDGLSRGRFERDYEEVQEDNECKGDFEDYRESRAYPVESAEEERDDPMQSLFQPFADLSVPARSDQGHSGSEVPAISSLKDVPKNWRLLIRFLQTATIPNLLSKKQRTSLRSRAANYFLKDGHLYRRRSTGIHQQVVFDESEQADIVAKLHEMAHRGVTAVTHAVTQRFWRPGLKATVTEVIHFARPPLGAITNGPNISTPCSTQIGLLPREPPDTPF